MPDTHDYPLAEVLGSGDVIHQARAVALFGSRIETRCGLKGRATGRDGGIWCPECTARQTAAADATADTTEAAVSEPMSEERLAHISGCLEAPNVVTSGLAETFAVELLAEVERLREDLKAARIRLDLLALPVSAEGLRALLSVVEQQDGAPGREAVEAEAYLAKLGYVCCVCGESCNFGYRNYLNQLFCWACADGEPVVTDAAQDETSAGDGSHP